MALTTNTNAPLVTATFRTRDDAEKAYRALETRGYTRDDVNLLMSDDARSKHFNKDHVGAPTDLESKALEGAGAGSAIGGTVGAVVAAIAAIGTSLALPGLGLIIAGPLAAAFAGAGAGGLAGGLVGALVGSGIPEDRAKAYETQIREGNIVMGVRPRTTTEAEEIKSDWKHYGSDVHVSLPRPSLRRPVAFVTPGRRRPDKM